MNDRWTVHVRKASPGSPGAFPRFPDGVAELPPTHIIQRHVEVSQQFLELPTLGSIYVPPLVTSDLRFRLVQAHEILHLYHNRFRAEAHKIIRSYLVHCVGEGLLPKGQDAYGPVLLSDDEPIESARDLCIIDRRPNSCVALCTVPESVLACGIVLSQLDELFADFFSAAAAGIAYWSSMVDFELRDSALQSPPLWHVNYPEVFEPHPPAWLRLRYLPRLAAEVLCEAAMASTSEKYWLMTLLAQYFQERVSPKLSEIPPYGLLTYSNDDAPQETRCVTLPVELLLPFYRAVFEGFTVALNEWWCSAHPLAMFANFFHVEYHARIQELARQFSTGVPTPNDGLDAVAGAAAARIAFDQDLAGNNKHPEMAILEARARAFLQRCNELRRRMVIPIRFEASAAS